MAFAPVIHAAPALLLRAGWPIITRKSDSLSDGASTVASAGKRALPESLSRQGADIASSGKRQAASGEQQAAKRSATAPN